MNSSTHGELYVYEVRIPGNILIPRAPPNFLIISCCPPSTRCSPPEHQRLYTKCESRVRPESSGAGKNRLAMYKHRLCPAVSRTRRIDMDQVVLPTGREETCFSF